jgi:hypothetical protein
MRQDVHKTSDVLAERISAGALVLVVLAVFGGFLRLTVSHWSYSLLIVVLAVSAKYLLDYVMKQGK